MPEQSFTERLPSNYREVFARFIGELVFVRMMDGRRFGGVLESIHNEHALIGDEPVRFDEVWKLYSTGEVIS